MGGVAQLPLLWSAGGGEGRRVRVCLHPRLPAHRPQPELLSILRLCLVADSKRIFFVQPR